MYCRIAPRVKAVKPKRKFPCFARMASPVGAAAAARAVKVVPALPAAGINSLIANDRGVSIHGMEAPFLLENHIFQL
jgi:hypothetical protein